MPFAEEAREGLVFVAFGRTLDAYTTLLRHMVGADDGVVDALFRFTRPVTGATFWCPPVREGRLDLRAIGF
jgi:putative iron-dependent peroxidase